LFLFVRHGRLPWQERGQARLSIRSRGLGDDRPELRASTIPRAPDVRTAPGDSKSTSRMAATTIGLMPASTLCLFCSPTSASAWSELLASGLTRVPPPSGGAEDPVSRSHP